jgi:Acetyltransferase (GNAT) domain
MQTGLIDLTPDAHLVPTIFHEPWWMEIACIGGGGETTVSSGGRLVGRLPYQIAQRAPGLKVIGMPRMAHVLGPAFAPEFTGQNFAHSTKQLSITRDLIAQLPKAAHISFRLHGGMTHTLAFAEAGFSSSVDFTVEISPDAPEVLWRGMRDKTRNVIRRAQERLTVRELTDLNLFLDFYETNLTGKRAGNHYDRTVCYDLMTECLRRGAGRILVATGPDGEHQSAIFTIWDRRTAYYFMSTRTLASMNGATSLLIWTAIQHAALRGLTFDMDILHLRNKRLTNLLLLTGFGGTLKPRYWVRRTAPILQVAQDMMRFLKLRD